MIEKLQKLKEKHGDQKCFLEYDGSVVHLDYVDFASVKADRDVYVKKPEGSIYTGIFFTEDGIDFIGDRETIGS